MIVIGIAEGFVEDEALGFGALDAHLGDVEDLPLLGFGLLANSFVFLDAIRREIPAAESATHQSIRRRAR